jgi:predicted HAD superfamily Cof-like phosphohydrolase
MDFFQKIVAWNTERNLLALGFNHKKEASFIIEELLESTGAYDSETARSKAELLAAEVVGDAVAPAETIVDAWADVIVFASGAIAKLGYDPSLVMEEVYKEINSRTGQLVDGKFVKDKNVVPYQADFTNCLR